MAIRSNERQSEIFKEFAVSKGYLGNSECWGTLPGFRDLVSAPEGLLEWYRSQPTDVLTTIGTFNFSASGFMACSPNFDGDFFEKPLDELRKEAPKKAFMIGGTEYEGLIMGKQEITRNLSQFRLQLYLTQCTPGSETLLKSPPGSYLDLMWWTKQKK